MECRNGEKLIAWYPFSDAAKAGVDASGNEQNAIEKGANAPVIKEVCGRMAAYFAGGANQVSYFELPKQLLKDVSDETGFTVSAWVCGDKANSVWERIFDFGNGAGGPYLFLTRFQRGVCFHNGDLAADAGVAIPVNEWVHVAMTVTGSKGGTLSSAGPRIYINGELAADGFISQTSSGTYKKLREWFATIEETDNYNNNYIGRSQFDADVDFCGAMSDFRIYKEALSEQDIIALMCDSLTEEEMVSLAKEKYLPAVNKIITEDLELPDSLMEGRVQVKWRFSNENAIDACGKVMPVKNAEGVLITAELSCGKSVAEKEFEATVLPKNVPPYELTVYGDKEILDISKTLYGLFYEDINNAADGGIYAEMIQNRSFECFEYDTYDARSGENGISTGRKHFPLRFWFGDLEKVEVKQVGGLREYFSLEDADANAYFISVESGTTLYNRGFCDNTLEHAMHIEKNGTYHFSLWAKSKEEVTIKVTLLDKDEKEISNTVEIRSKDRDCWEKYEAEVLTANTDCLGQIRISFDKAAEVDMLSLMPGQVWGACEEDGSSTAHANYLANSNYRLRKDLVETLVELHPTFLRFPGGCISEGSYIWDNVYDWKDSVGPVEVRKENFNVWGYMMTLGLGYMEYFQLAEDLHAEPLPVMACGVLCQARSDYANPAGGALQDKYIQNFIDLIDFAISIDFVNNKWAALRKEMGHEAPFGLHYLGVGNENWGTEFFASFEKFKHAIEKHMLSHYPGYELHIISTAGAQADDDAYQQGWKFLAGFMEGGAKVRFTDGVNSFDEDVQWYQHSKHHLDTIVDEHYYRSNEYLLENADRYNYYYRGYENGVLDENATSKVFVGEYASSDKNTLAGAVAEAAVMTGFEKNSDVVRLAATAPLFNKVVGDGTYRWTPDAIWFDNDSVWRTPNYYVQQMFAKYIGKKLLDSSYKTYFLGKKKRLRPEGAVVISAEGEVEFLQIKVVSNCTKDILFYHEFEKEQGPVKLICGNEELVLLPFVMGSKHGFYLDAPTWHDYTVELIVKKCQEDAVISVGVGYVKQSIHEYCVGDKKHGTGLRVYKDGKEAYTMGDYSSSVYAGNLRACYDEAVEVGKEYTITVNYGGFDGKEIICFYQDESSTQKALLSCKLEAYNRDIFHAVTADDEKVYMKLVNADEFDKLLSVKLKELSVEKEAETVLLTGEKEFWHTPNVNTKKKEVIAPVYGKIPVENNELTIHLPANSVTVAVLKKKLS